jgi:hypothetical protein
MYYKYALYVLKMGKWQNGNTVDTLNSKYFPFSRQKEEKEYTLLRWPQLRLESQLTTT